MANTLQPFAVYERTPTHPPTHTNTPTHQHSHAPAGKRGFYGGLVLSGVVLGVLLGAVVGTILRETLSPEDLQRFGFRIPFLCGFLVAVAGLALHKYVPDMSAVEAETGPGNEDAMGGSSTSHEPVPSLRASMTAQSSGAGSDATSPSASAPPAEAKPNPLKELFANYKLELFMGMPVLFLYCTGFYECLVWLAVRCCVLVLSIYLPPCMGHCCDPLALPKTNRMHPTDVHDHPGAARPHQGGLPHQHRQPCAGHPALPRVRPSRGYDGFCHAGFGFSVVIEFALAPRHPTPCLD